MACIKKDTHGSFYTCGSLDKVHYARPVVVSLTATGGHRPCSARREGGDKPPSVPKGTMPPRLTASSRAKRSRSDAQPDGM